MKIRKSHIIGIILIIIGIIAFNYNFFDTKLEQFIEEYEKDNVSRIIDGDTIETENTGKIRLLGIDTPERGEKYYEEAKEFLKNKIENKTIRLKFGNEKEGRYGRTLAFIIYNGKNLNKEIVEEGLSNPYFPGRKNPEYPEFKSAWNKCIKNNKNLCESSKHKCSKCIELTEFDQEKEKTTFENTCSLQCNLKGWKINDEGGKEFVFPKTILNPKDKITVKVSKNKSNPKENTIIWQRDSYVWTRGGDTLFIRDNQGKLVLWEGY